MSLQIDKTTAQLTVSTAPEISIEHLTFGHADQLLFKDFSFTVAAGQWTCLLGPSGCGKSTLLRLVSGSLTQGVAGRIQFAGQPRMRGQAAWMAQKDLLLPWLSVLENVLLGARLRGEMTAKKRLKAMSISLLFNS